MSPVLAEDDFGIDEEEFDLAESYDDFDDFDAYDDEDEFLGDLWRRAQAVRRWIRKSPAASAIAKGITTGAGGLAGVALGGRLSGDRRSGRPWGGVVGSALGGTLGNWVFTDEERTRWPTLDTQGESLGATGTIRVTEPSSSLTQITITVAVPGQWRPIEISTMIARL